MNRRTFLAGGVAAATAPLAGCGGLLETRQVGTRAPPLVADRPDAVYIPSHVEGMTMIGRGTAGRRRVGVMFSFPHRFWTVTGAHTSQVEIKSGDTIHLMASIWDTETGQVLPVGSGVSFDITRQGESITQRAPWPMLSQNMGFHYGDNFALPGEGTYTVSVDAGTIGIRQLGDFQGAFQSTDRIEVTFEYSRRARNEISFTRLDERKGDRGAVESMDMGMMPLSIAPARDELPGRILGEATTGDAVLLATLVDRDGPYLAVSPRTPYNRFILPLMAVSATVDRKDETVFDGPLSKAIDPGLGYHYGASVPGLNSGDSLTVTVNAPPQVSRHEGYETAFLEMPPVSLSVP